MKLVNFSSVLMIVLVVGSCSTEEFHSQGVRALVRVYDECQKSDYGFTACLKKRAITFMDRVARLDAFSLGEGVKVMKTGGVTAVETPKSLSDNELEQILPRGLEARDIKLNSMLVDRISGFLNSHTVQMSLPKVSADEIGRSVEEGRGKMKKMMNMMMMGFMMKMAAMVPVAMAGLYMLAGKALIVSKIALLLASIIGLKKLLSGKQSSGGWQSGGSSGGWSSGGGGGGGHSSGGWDRRSLDGQDLAYKAYVSPQKE